jgi:radical SAM-linked protein
MESVAECVEMALAQDVAPDEFLMRIAKALPPGLQARRTVALPDGAPKLMAALRVAEYAVELGGDRDAIARAVDEVLAEAQVLADKTSKGATKRIDIRGMILGMDWRDGRLMLRLAAAPEGSLRPELVMDALRERAGAFEYRAVRTGLFVVGPGGERDLLAHCQSFE